MMTRCIEFAILFCSPALLWGSPVVDNDQSLRATLESSACGDVVEQPLSLLQDRAKGVTAKSAASLRQDRAAAEDEGKSNAVEAISNSKHAAGRQKAVKANHTNLDTSRTGDAQISTGTATICIVIVFLSLGLATLMALSRGSDAEPGLPKYVAEFVGTFMLIFSVGCNVLVGDATWGIVSIACTLMVSIYALGGVSGGNFNPAVSVALGLSGKMLWKEVAIYVCTQLAAGVTASLTYGLMLGATFNLKPSDGYSWWQAGLGELLYTFMLCTAVLNTAASKKHGGKDQFYGLSIGFSVVAGGYGAGSISGGCFNPAVALGIDASSIGLGFGWCFVYFVFEIIGACIASALFRLCRPEDFDEAAAEEPPLSVCLLSEFLGTYMLILTVGLNVLGNSKAAVFSIAASLMCMIFSLGSVSGAHFNPAVTVAVLCSNRGVIAIPRAAMYMAVQFAGGVTAAFTYSAMQNGRTVSLKPSGSPVEALLGEFLFTFLLSFVVLCVATIKSPLSQYFGLAIGSCVTAGGLAIGNLSGGSLNPAVSTGLALSDMSNGGSLAHLPSYVAAEVLGGVLAAGAFRATYTSEYTEKA